MATVAMVKMPAAAIMSRHKAMRVSMRPTPAWIFFPLLRVRTELSRFICSSLVVPGCVAIFGGSCPDLAKAGRVDRYGVDLRVVSDVDRVIPRWRCCSGVDRYTSRIQGDAGRGSHLPHPSSIHRNATRPLAYAVGLGIGWGRSHSTGPKADARREALNWAYTHNCARIVDIAYCLPAAGSAESGFVPRFYVEGIYGISAQVDVHPSPREVRSRLHLGLVNGAVQVPGVSGDAQGPERRH